jgi:hypothetical protein
MNSALPDVSEPDTRRESAALSALRHQIRKVDEFNASGTPPTVSRRTRV